jgi:hypothetical protein
MINPDSADWYKAGAVSMEAINYVLQQLSPLELVKVKTTKGTKQFLGQLSKKSELYLISGWLNTTESRKKGNVKKAKAGKQVVVHGEEAIFSIQKVGEHVRVKWEPMKAETLEPMESLKDIEEIHTEAFKSGSEVEVGKGTSFAGPRKIFAMKKQDREKKARGLEMHAIPAWRHLDLCRDPLKPTKANQSWIEGGTDLRAGIWEHVFQQDKWSTSILQLQPTSRAFKFKRPNEFLNPGPASTRMADTATTALTESTASTAADVKRKSSFSSSGSDSVKRARVNSPPQL